MSEQWIVVRNWEKFQRYRGRRPTWIKVYIELLDDPNYLGLTDVQRSLLHGLWLMYGKSRGCVPLSVEIVNRWLELRIKMASLQALNHAGFIEFSAQPLHQHLFTSAPKLAHKRREEKISPHTPLLREEKKNPPLTPPGGDVVAVYNHWRTARKKTDRRYDRISEGRRRKIVARLREFTADDLKQALDAVALDNWNGRARNDDLTILLGSRERVDKWLDLSKQGNAKGESPWPLLSEPA